MMAVYHLVADAMERLGIQPIKPTERPVERRQALQGRRRSDSGWQFLLDHAILTLIEVSLAVLAYSFFFGGAQ